MVQNLRHSEKQNAGERALRSSSKPKAKIQKIQTLNLKENLSETQERIGRSEQNSNKGT